MSLFARQELCFRCQSSVVRRQSSKPSNEKDRLCNKPVTYPKSLSLKNALFRSLYQVFDPF